MLQNLEAEEFDVVVAVMKAGEALEHEEGFTCEEGEEPNSPVERIGEGVGTNLPRVLGRLQLLEVSHGLEEPAIISSLHHHYISITSLLHYDYIIITSLLH